MNRLQERGNDMKKYFKKTELAEYLGVSIRTIERWVKKGLIVPSISDGRTKRYCIEDLRRER